MIYVHDMLQQTGLAESGRHFVCHGCVLVMPCRHGLEVKSRLILQNSGNRPHLGHNVEGL